jgi:hypothetical protein
MADIGEIKGKITLDASGVKSGAQEAETALDGVKAKEGELQSSGSKTKASFVDTAQSATALAMSAYVLYDSYDGVQQAQTAADRANLKLSKSQEAVTTAQDKLNAAIAKYGADSPEATQATLDLQQAQEQVTIATQNAEMAAGNCDDAWVQFALGGITSTLGLISGGAGLIKSLKDMPSVMGLVGKASGALSNAFSFLAANPIVLVLMAIALIAVLIITNWDTLRPYFEALWNAIKGIFEAAWNVIMAVVNAAIGFIQQYIIGPFTQIREFLLGIMNAIFGVFQAAWNSIMAFINGAIQVIKDYIINPFIQIREALLGVLNGIKKIFEDVWNAIIGVVKGAIDFIKGLIDMIMGPINDVRDAVGSIVPEGDVIPGLHLFGEGGRVTRPTLSITGEKEPETMIPDSKMPGFISAMVSNSQEYAGIDRLPVAAASSGRGGSFNNVFNISTNDPEEVAQTVVRALQRQGIRSVI